MSAPHLLGRDVIILDVTTAWSLVHFLAARASLLADPVISTLPSIISLGRSHTFPFGKASARSSITLALLVVWCAVECANLIHDKPGYSPFKIELLRGVNSCFTIRIDKESEKRERFKDRQRRLRTTYTDKTATRTSTPSSRMKKCRFSSCIQHVSLLDPSCQVTGYILAPPRQRINQPAFVQLLLDVYQACPDAYAHHH